MQVPIISVIVPSFNAGGTIARAVRALERQQTAVPYEVIVVDSGTDGTAEFVAREFPAVRLVRSAERKYGVLLEHEASGLRGVRPVPGGNLLFRHRFSLATGRPRRQTGVRSPHAG